MKIYPQKLASSRNKSYFCRRNFKSYTMTALELQSEYQSLVSIIANEDYETISKAVKALKKILSPNKTKAKKITKADLVIDPRIAAMTKGIHTPETFDYKNEYYKDYIK